MRPACNESTVQAGSRAYPLAKAILILGLPSGCLMLAAGSAHAQIPCPAPTTSFAVAAEHYPPVIKSSYTSVELRALAGQVTHKSPHPPLGFYAGTFGYRLEVLPPAAQGCGMTVTVRLFLAPRLVEVATDGPCRPEVVVEHYLLHARQDDLLLSHYAAQVQEMLDHIEQTGWSRGDDASGRDNVVRSVSTAVDHLLKPYDDDRQHALRAADTDDALARLAQGCGRAT